VGDRVKHKDGSKIESSGWTMDPGDIGIVTVVDRDGDFKLSNTRGLESGWQYRKAYVYAQTQPLQPPGTSSSTKQSGPPPSSKQAALSPTLASDGPASSFSKEREVNASLAFSSALQRGGASRSLSPMVPGRAQTSLTGPSPYTPLAAAAAEAVSARSESFTRTVLAVSPDARSDSFAGTSVPSARDARSVSPPVLSRPGPGWGPPPAPLRPAPDPSRGQPPAAVRRAPGASPSGLPRRTTLPARVPSFADVPNTVAVSSRATLSGATVQSSGVQACPDASWAYSSDSEILQLAEQVLSGLVSAALLQRLGRRDLVGLLIAQGACPSSLMKDRSASSSPIKSGAGPMRLQSWQRAQQEQTTSPDTAASTQRSSQQFSSAALSARLLSTCSRSPSPVSLRTSPQKLRQDSRSQSQSSSPVRVRRGAASGGGRAAPVQGFPVTRASASNASAPKDTAQMLWASGNFSTCPAAAVGVAAGVNAVIPLATPKVPQGLQTVTPQSLAAAPNCCTIQAAEVGAAGLAAVRAAGARAAVVLASSARGSETPQPSLVPELLEAGATVQTSVAEAVAQLWCFEEDRQGLAAEPRQPQPQGQPLLAYPPSGASSPILTARPPSPTRIFSGRAAVAVGLPPGVVEATLAPPEPLVMRRAANSRSSWPLEAAEGSGPLAATLPLRAKLAAAIPSRLAAAGSRSASASTLPMARTTSTAQLLKGLARTDSAAYLRQAPRTMETDAPPPSARFAGDDKKMEMMLAMKLAAANRDLQVAQSAASRLAAANRELAVAQGAAQAAVTAGAAAGAAAAVAFASQTSTAARSASPVPRRQAAVILESPDRLNAYATPLSLPYAAGVALVPGVMQPTCGGSPKALVMTPGRAGGPSVPLRLLSNPTPRVEFADQANFDGVSLIYVATGPSINAQTGPSSTSAAAFVAPSDAAAEAQLAQMAAATTQTLPTEQKGMQTLPDTSSATQTQGESYADRNLQELSPTRIVVDSWMKSLEDERNRMLEPGPTALAKSVCKEAGSQWEEPVPPAPVPPAPVPPAPAVVMVAEPPPERRRSIAEPMVQCPQNGHAIRSAASSAGPMAEPASRAGAGRTPERTRSASSEKSPRKEEKRRSVSAERRAQQKSPQSPGEEPSDKNTQKDEKRRAPLASPRPKRQVSPRPRAEAQRSQASWQVRKLDDVPKSALALAKVFPNAEAAADHLMNVVDWRSRTSGLTVVEAQAFLNAPPFTDFMRWITKTKQWLAFDQNRTGFLDVEELRAALYEYWRVASGQPATVVARSASPPRKRKEQQKERNEADDVRIDVAELKIDVAELKAQSPRQKALPVKVPSPSEEAELERSRLQGALRQWQCREQDYDELLATKTREIEALQRRTEDKMIRLRLGQGKRTSPSMTLLHCFDRDPLPQPAVREDPPSSLFHWQAEDTELASTCEIATTATESVPVFNVSLADEALGSAAAAINTAAGSWAAAVQRNSLAGQESRTPRFASDADVQRKRPSFRDVVADDMDLATALVPPRPQAAALQRTLLDRIGPQ